MIELADLPAAGSYACILADPPWKFRGHTTTPGDRDAVNHYRVMTIGDIKAMPIRALAARDAHLFLWTPGCFIPQALDVVKEWGFRFSSMGFTWAKLKSSYDRQQVRFIPTIDADFAMQLGMTTRKGAEFCLLGRRGNARRIGRGVRELIIAPVRAHSQKPDDQYERIERYCDGPRVELFARQRWPGWDAWGNQVPE